SPFPAVQPRKAIANRILFGYPYYPTIVRMAQSLGQYRLGVGTMWNARRVSTVRAKLWGFTSPLFNLLLNHLVALTAGLFELSLVDSLNLAPTIVVQNCLI